jgi:iron complex outermembrane receptor protein
MLCFTGLPRRSVSRVFATLLCLTPYRLAFAETTYALTDITVMAAPHSGNIVSTATLLPAAPLDLPFSATRLMVEALGDRHPTDIADLADYSPGISRSSNYWGMDTPTFHLRGFNAGESTAYYRDGFRYQARGPVPMANVEALEILRGPVSALYGWSDPGGAVQIITKKPVPYPLRQFSAEVNQWGKARLVADRAAP